MPPRPIQNPKNPWHTSSVEWLEPPPKARLEVFQDASRSIVSRNDSPDLGFRWSVNPYRGCMHACAYCYARPYHEYLDFGAGTDFDRKIVIKQRAAELLRATFDKPSWKGETLLFSGATDCYQPLEASLQLTRTCLEVCRDYHHPLGIITKAPLIERDLDLLRELHACTRLRVTISVPFWNVDHARKIEPFVAKPARRIQTIERLADAGLDVGVNIGPMIPGLTDEDVPKILEAAASAGARRAALIFLRLPKSVASVFEQRVREAFPDRANKILNRVRDARGGKLNDTRFGHRMRGEGPHARSVDALFQATARRLGLRTSVVPVEDEEATTFRRPPRRGSGEQLDLLS